MRNGEAQVARDAIERLTRYTLDDSDWAMGIEARSRALVSEGERAEHWYGEAVKRLARTSFRGQHAFEFAKVGNLGADVREMMGGNGLHLGTGGLLARRVQIEQGPDVAEGKA